LEKLFAEAGFKVLEPRPVGGSYSALIQTALVSQHCREIQSLLARAVRRALNVVRLPVLNWLALNLDRLLWNDKLCLNCLLVVVKD